MSVAADMSTRSMIFARHYMVKYLSRTTAIDGIAVVHKSNFSLLSAIKFIKIKGFIVE